MKATLRHTLTMAFLFPECPLGLDGLVDLSGITWMTMMTKREKKKGREEDAHKEQSLFDVMNACYHVFAFAPGCMRVAFYYYFPTFFYTLSNIGLIKEAFSLCPPSVFVFETCLSRAPSAAEGRMFILALIV